MALSDRLQELMDEYGLKTRGELARFAGVSSGLVTQWFTGDTQLGAKPLIRFSERTRFCMRWLFDGTGPKYRSDAPVVERRRGVDRRQNRRRYADTR